MVRASRSNESGEIDNKSSKKDYFENGKIKENWKETVKDNTKKINCTSKDAQNRRRCNWSTPII